MSAAQALVGRDAEVRALQRTIQVVEGGESRAVGIVGEPGIGKSRLLDELGRLAAARGNLVLAGRATELERDVPFGLWVDALDDHLAGEGAALLEGLAAEQVADLAVALPAVARVAVGPPAAVERHRVARAVRVVLAKLAASAPVTVLLDDVQWADAAAADVIALMLHRPPDGPVVLALAARAGRAPALESVLATAARRRAAEVVEVGPLSREAADLLMPGIGSTARAQLYAESGGNPFYLEELLRAGPLGARSAPTGGAPGVPHAVRAALTDEIAALGADARLVAQAGAVAGDPFDPAIAAAAADVDDARALAALDSLLVADLVRPTEDPRRFGFRHPLVGRAVYESGGGGWRLAAHARAADALAARGAPATERAHHVERAAQAGDLDAVELLAFAPEQTVTSAPATAAGWYAAALRLLPGGSEHGERRLELLVAQAEALASAGSALEARDVLRRVLAMLPADLVDRRVRVAVALAELEAIWTQQPEAARALLEAERAALGDVAPAAAAELTLALATERNEYGDFGAVLALCEQGARRRAGRRRSAAGGARRGDGRRRRELRSARR